MKLIMTLLVRDEEDIVGTNIDYHLAQGVDFIIVTDNLSADRTPDILRQYEAKGSVKLICEMNDTYDQDIWVTRMARQAYSEFGADWVINNDADEFWWPREGNLKDAFEKVSPEASSLLASRFNFVPKDLVRAPFYSYMTHREVVSFNSLGAPLPGKMAHRGSPFVNVAQGNHSAAGLPQDTPATGLIDIFHFPVRSYRQIENKISKGGAAYSRNTRLLPGVGQTWRTLYCELQQQGNLRRYFESLEHNLERLTQRQMNGEIVEDLRLKHFLIKHVFGR